MATKKNITINVDGEFIDVEIVEAPADFAPAVMARVTALDLYKSSKFKLADILIFVPFVIFVAVIFVAASVAFFGPEGFEPIADWLRSAAASFASFFADMPMQLMMWLSVGFLTVFAALVTLQVGLTHPAHHRRIGE